jgi:hypothetical protein
VVFTDRCVAPLITGTKQSERSGLARSVTDRDGVKAILSQVAQEYEELAEDLEGGAVEIRHSELTLESHRRCWI